MNENRSPLTRREWLAVSSLSLVSLAPSAPSAPVSIGKYAGYGGDLAGGLAKQFDQIGGLGKLVSGKSVAIKLNLTGGGRLGTYTAGQTQWVHPDLVGACCHLLGRAGAKRIRLLEGFGRGDSLEDKILKVAKPYIYPAFDLNHSYQDTDVFISMSKLKHHEECGITLTIKNSFGITPNSIYGDDAGLEEPNENTRRGREAVLHAGKRQPPKSAPQEVDFTSPRFEGYRVPRICADLIAARPVDLAIIDGIESSIGGKGPWVRGFKYARLARRPSTA